MLSWTDVLKISVPFLSSLVLLWIKGWYEDRRERITKQETLWRSLVQDAKYIDVVQHELDHILRATKEEKARLVVLHVSPTSVDFARRLAELDPGNSYVYTDFSDWSDIVNQGFRCLWELQKSHITSPPDCRNRISAALESQIRSLKGDLLSQAEAGEALLDVLAKTKRFDVQPLRQYKDVVSHVRQGFRPAEGRVGA